MVKYEPKRFVEDGHVFLMDVNLNVLNVIDEWGDDPHNGPICVLCGETICILCLPEYKTDPCLERVDALPGMDYEVVGL